MPPKRPLPEPLRARETPSFTNYSVVVRLPDIARRTLAENDFEPQAAARIQQLIDEIPNSSIRPVEAAGAKEWASWVIPQLGKNWLDVPWFFAEEYFYLRILEATGYFEPGEGWRRDPYLKQKRLGLESTRESLRKLVGHVQAALEPPAGDWRETLEQLLLADLWGNQNDLSMWPVKSGGKPGESGSAAAGEGNQSTNEHILNNETGAALDFISGLSFGEMRIDLLLDNAGYELAADLALADYLLTGGLAANVTLHAKSHPVFVSDALVRDIHDTLDFLVLLGDAPARSMAVRLRSNLIRGRLRLLQHPMWTSPLAAWEIPDSLCEEMASTDLLIVKGDANYRRLLGDRHWPYELPFSAVVDYLPFAALALRTLKSEITLGVPPERIPAGDPKWMTNGRWGLIQFAPPAGPVGE